MTRSCGRLTVATFLTLLLGQKVATLEQRLYEWGCEASHSGRQTASVGGHHLFCALTALDRPTLDGHPLALALDATALGTRFVVLAVCVVYRGGAIPVAWTMLPANQPGA